MTLPTISANTLSISHKGTPGWERNTTPDVCLTPPEPKPVPYSIISYSRDLENGSETVFADGGHSIAIKGSRHFPCTGDEPGSAGGVVSGTNVHESTWITYSADIYVEGRNICRLTDKMFMNRKNCVSASGHYEAPASITDPILRELCKVFCEVREEWQRCRSSGRTDCGRPSDMAKRRTEGLLGDRNSALNRGIRSRFPGGLGRAEQTFYTLADEAADGARKIYDQSALRRAIQRRVQAAVRNRVIAQGAKLAGRAWLKVVPGLNILSGIVDAVDTAYSAYEIYDMISSSDDIANGAIRIAPDVGIQDADGVLSEAYDYKFDAAGYQDDWQAGQEEAYRRATGRQPIKVDNATCQCDLVS